MQLCGGLLLFPFYLVKHKYTKIAAFVVIFIMAITVVSLPVQAADTTRVFDTNDDALEYLNELVAEGVELPV